MDTFDSDYIIFQKDGVEYLVVEFDVPEDLRIYQSQYSPSTVEQAWHRYHSSNPKIRLPEYIDKQGQGYVSQIQCQNEALVIVYRVVKPKEVISGRNTQRKSVKLLATVVLKV